MPELVDLMVLSMNLKEIKIKLKGYAKAQSRAIQQRPVADTGRKISIKSRVKKIHAIHSLDILAELDRPA